MKDFIRQHKKTLLFLIFILFDLIIITSVLFFFKSEILEAFGVNKKSAIIKVDKKKIANTENEKDNPPQNSQDTPQPQPITSDGESLQPQAEPQPPVASGNWWDYPAQISLTTKSGDDLLVLVNKSNRLPESYAPADLVSIADYSIRTVGAQYIRSIAITDLKAMISAASSAGIDISIISSYRSYSNQVSTYNYWVSYNGGNTNAADQISARPGHSQHQLGTTVDFSSSQIGDRLGSEFNGTAANAWLLANAHNYGFVLSYPAGAEAVTGYSHESWHWRYIGVGNAQEFKASGAVLDTWLTGR